MVTPFLFIFLASITQALSVNAIRDIQASSINIYRAIMWGYAASVLLGVVYIAFIGLDQNWYRAIPYGMFTGFFYIVSLVTMIRSMGQRGLAITIAIANISMVMAVGLAIFYGDMPTSLQYAGIFIAVIAIPILSLSTASGRAIREAPSAKLAMFLFVVRGLAAVGNLVGERSLDEPVLPVYVTSLFASCLVYSIIVLFFVDNKTAPADIRLGATFGVLNIAATSSLIFALTKVSGAIVFAAYSVLGIAFTVLFALWFWRERIHRWGWIGFALAVIATILMRLGDNS